MHRVKFSPGLALIALRTTDPWFSFSFSATKRKSQWPSENVQEINKPFVRSHARVARLESKGRADTKQINALHHL